MNVELENFIIKFQAEKNHHDKAAQLHSFVQSFFETSKEDVDLKQAMFLDLISKIPELFAILTRYENLTNNFNASAGLDERELNTSNLQGATLCLEVLLMCFNQSEYSEHLSLFSTTINVLHQSYTHCKDSEELYGNLLEDFTDQLANFLNKIQTVQRAMLSGMSYCITSELSDSQVRAIIATCNNLGNLCNLVMSLDKVIAVQLWRIFTKIISKYPERSQETVSMDPIISSLISQILEIVDEYRCKMESDELIEESEIKIFLYFTNLFMKLFHTFHNSLRKSFQPMLLFALKLSDFLLLSYSPEISDENSPWQLRAAVGNTAKSIVPLLFSNVTFLNEILELDKDTLPHLYLAHVLLKLSALGYMVSNKDFMKEKNSEDIFMKTVAVLNKNDLREDIKFTCIKIPSSMFQYLESGEQYNEELVPVYHHIYIQFAKYSKTISDIGFEKIEGHLLKLLVSSSDLMSVLISDIWIYRLRCSSVKYLHARVTSLLKSFLQFQSNLRYKYLLRRMLKFLPKDVLTGLLEEQNELKHLIQNPNKVTHRYGIPDLITLQKNKDDSQILNMVALSLNKFKRPAFENSQLITKACCLLELFSLLINVSPNSEIVKFGELASYLFKSDIYKVQIAVLTFLKAFKGKSFDENNIDFRNVVRVLASLFADTLKSRNCIVKYEAFRTYASLAQAPSLRKVCRQTVAIAPDLASDINSYFSKLPSNGFLTEKERMKNLQKLLQCQPDTTVTNDIQRLLPLKSI
ncbi:hypothetical protein JTE90_023266 [Oedothorax gibbosus]|uniref:Uncharacterized protein n=1 Tax=Oedothorax gibbosus TaxID=931172 RepID=A0AAV6U3S3_9ARAC|nr:hypothetical protein JTE90_023266 [Oedothorax gibbosus]